MTGNYQNVQQTVPTAWERELTRMSEEWAAEETTAQVQQMRKMIACVEARTDPCYRLKIDRARSRIADKGAKRVSFLRWSNQLEPAERVLEATQTYLELLTALERAAVQDGLTQEKFARLVEQLTEECLFVIENPDIWPA